MIGSYSGLGFAIGDGRDQAEFFIEFEHLEVLSDGQFAQGGFYFRAINRR